MLLQRKIKKYILYRFGSLLILFLFGHTSGQCQDEQENPLIKILQPHFGLYEIENGTNGVMMGMLEQYPVLFFPDGQIRGIFESDGEFVIGNSIGKIDSVEGTVRWEKSKKEELLIIGRMDGTETTARKIELKQRELNFRSAKNDFIERQKDFKKSIWLYGTLILPKGKGPFPAVVFSHGSGQESREASRGLAMFFAYNGIASFIFDKRGVGRSEGEHWAASFSDYAGDLLGAVRLLKTQPEIKKHKIGLYGHSQGGWIVPLAISKDPTDISFAILSAANCVSPLEQHMYNGRRILKLQGYDSTVIAEVEAFRRNKYAASLGVISKEKFENEILPEARQKVWLSKQKLTNENLGVDQFFEFNTYYDPLPALSMVKCPILVLYAQKDNFTDAVQNLRLMQEQFRNNDNKMVTYKMFENANHAMLYTATGRFYNRELPLLKKFADGYLDLLVNWTKEVTR